MKIKKKLIEVALPLDAINTASPKRSPFGMGTRVRCIYGGRVNRWRRRGR